MATESEDRLKGIADAIRVIRAMGHQWPDAIGLPASQADDYGNQFVRRILEQFPDAEKFVPFGSRGPGASVPPDSYL